MLTTSSLAVLTGRTLAGETRSLLARFTVAQEGDQVRRMDAMVKALKGNGIWPKFDGLAILAAADAQAAQRNWVVDSFNLSVFAGSPVFTAYRGYAGDAVSACLTTSFNPSTAGGRFAQNNAHMMVWQRATVSDTGYTFGNGNSRLRRISTTGSVDLRSNAVASDNIASGLSAGFALWSRSNSANYDFYNNTTAGVNITHASAVHSNNDLLVLAQAAGANPTAAQVAAISWGSTLTAVEAAIFYNILSTYMVAVGAA